MTNASNHPRLRSADGKGAVAARAQLENHGADAVLGDDLFVVVSGRAPERPIFVVRPGARGDLTLPDGERESEAIAWSRTGRGSYMPTPLNLQGHSLRARQQRPA